MRGRAKERRRDARARARGMHLGGEDDLVDRGRLSRRGSARTCTSLNLSNPGHRLWSRMHSNFLAVAATSSLTGDISLRRRRRSLGCGVSLRDSPASPSSARARGRALHRMTLGCTFPRQIFFEMPGKIDQIILAQRSSHAAHHTALHPTAVDHVYLPPSRRRPRREGRAPHHSRRSPRVAASPPPSRPSPRAPKRSEVRVHALLFRVASSPRAARPRLPSPIPDPPLASASQAFAVSPTSPTTTSSRCALGPRRRHPNPRPSRERLG